MRNSGMDAIFPLWLADSNKTTAQLADEMIAAGVKAVLTCVDPKRLPKEFAGRFWDKQLLQVISVDSKLLSVLVNASKALFHMVLTVI